jgi:hypothetical protein
VAETKYYFGMCLDRLGKATRNLRIAGVRAQFQPERLPNIIQERHRYASTLGVMIIHKNLINSMEYSPPGEVNSSSVKKFFVFYGA